MNGTEPRARLAIFGGSFDPPHVGHLLAATWVVATQDVSGIVVIPTFEHPLEKLLAPFTHRRRMCELTFSAVGRIEVSDLEAQLGGASYTVRTLEHLAAQVHGRPLSLMVGTDIVDDIPKWKDGHRIEELAELLVVGRGGYHDDEGDLVMPKVSSTAVRERVAAEQAIDGLVPTTVEKYIRRHGLYR